MGLDQVPSLIENVDYWMDRLTRAVAALAAALPVKPSAEARPELHEAEREHQRPRQ